jgi:hypothetical protein
MKRVIVGGVMLSFVVFAVGALRADVKTQEKSLVKFEGGLGRMMNMFGGKAAKDGLVSAIAVKGVRKATLNDTNGQIVDLAEEKIYDINVRDKSYTVMTFAEYRKRLEEAQAKAKQDMKEAEKEQPEPGEKKEVEVDFDLKETGQTKAIAGYATKEVIMTITVREKGKTLEEAGGMVMTSDMWMADPIPAMAEIQAFDRKYFEKLHGPLAAGMDAQQMAMVSALYPMMKDAAEKMQKEGVRLKGTPLSTTTKVEGVKSKAQMEQAASQSQGSGGGGLGGMMARKMMKKAPENPSGRSTIFTTAHDVLSIAASAEDGDVAVPAGYKDKTKK